MTTIPIATDVFSDSQVRSKMWLAELLAIHLPCEMDEYPNAWILGGWHGMLSFMLLTGPLDEKFKFEQIRSFDIDPSCEGVAKQVNAAFMKDGQFDAHTVDCNELNYIGGQYGNAPNLIINTSAEHFPNMDWWDRIPVGMMVAIQSNNMKHEQHCAEVEDLDEFENKYPLYEYLHLGATGFTYPDKSFQRYTMLGRK